MQSINACACKHVCLCMFITSTALLLVLHFTYCISCGDFPGMVLDCMITVMILNLVLIPNKSSIQFILVNLSDRQLQIEKKEKKFFCSLYTIIFHCNMLSLCWRALVCVANTTVLGCLCTWLGVRDRRLHTPGNFIGRNTLGSSPKMLARGLEPPGGSIYMYYGVHTTCLAFLFEWTFLVIHCQTCLWNLTLIGSWTAPSLWSRYCISLRYISYFILLLLCFSLVVVFGACY